MYPNVEETGVKCLCNQEVRACCKLASVANYLPDRCFLLGPKKKRWQFLDSTLPTRFWAGLQYNRWKFMAYCPYGLNFMPSNFHIFGPLKKHVTDNLFCWRDCEGRCHIMGTATWYRFLLCQDVWRSDVYCLLSMCYIYIYKSKPNNFQNC